MRKPVPLAPPSVEADFGDRWVFSVKEVAEKLGVSDDTIHTMLASGQLKGIKVRGARRITRDSLRELFAGAAR